MILALVAGVSMLVKDALGAGYVIHLQRGHKWLAGVFDGLSDLAAVGSLGAGTAAVYVHGVHLEALPVLGAILASSVLGTRLGAEVVERICDRGK